MSADTESLLSLALLNRRYRLALLAFFLRRLRNPADAEDLTHEVFLRVAAAGNGQSIVRPDAYVFQTAANLLRDRGRREQFREATDWGVTADFAVADEATPERILVARETLQLVLAALGELSSRTRTIFVLYRLENMTQREIAELLALSPSTIEKNIVKATQYLYERLESAR